MFRAIQRFRATAHVARGTQDAAPQRGEAQTAPQQTLGAAVDPRFGSAAADGQPWALVVPGQSAAALAWPQNQSLPPVPRPRLTSQTLAAWAHAPGIGALELPDRQTVMRRLLEAARPLPGSFPTDALFIPGDVVLEGLMALSALPQGLTIGGSLLIDNMPSLTALPSHLTVDGSIKVKGCTALTAIHDHIVAGKMVLDDCPALTDVSATLKTAYFELTGATRLVALPAELQPRTLKLTGCTALQSLPNGESLRKLSVIGCTSLTHLPDHLVLDVLDATGCTALRTLPDDFSGDDVCLKGCTSLQQLPEELQAYRLDLTDCIGITQIDDPVAMDVLICSGCINLTSLPPSMHIEELDATGCTALKVLPKALEVDRLTLVGCSALVTLPDDMLVRKYCDLRGCTSVQRLPRRMDAQGYVNTGDCTALTFAAAKARVSSSPNMMKALLAAQEDLGGASFGNLIFSSEIDFFVSRVPFAERLGLLRAAQQMYAIQMEAEDFRDIVAGLVHVTPEDHATFIPMATEILAMFAQSPSTAAQLIRTLGELRTHDARVQLLARLRDELWVPDEVAEYRDIKTALSDVKLWHSQLADTQTTCITQAQADEVICPILHTTFAEMECPVAVYTGHVLHVFELEALLTWLQTSIESRRGADVGLNPTNNLPLPLSKLLRADIAR